MNNLFSTKMRSFLNLALKFYKGTLSFLLKVLFGKGCRFLPTCSEYAKEAIEKYGFLKGTVLSAKRISRCHPFTKPAFDPVV